MKNVADFYNKTATGWSAEWYKEKLQSEILVKFYNCYAGAGTNHPKILDLGCGAGYDSKILAKLGAKMTGIDISEELIKIAKKQVVNCKFFVGDLTEKYNKLGKFDGILCLATIMHVGTTKMKQTFDNMVEVLNKGGLVLVSAADGNGKNYEKSIVNIDGEVYDKNFNCYNATDICAFAHPKLKLVDTWKFEDFAEGWRYYVFMKL